MREAREEARERSRAELSAAKRERQRRAESAKDRSKATCEKHLIKAARQGLCMGGKCSGKQPLTTITLLINYLLLKTSSVVSLYIRIE